MKTKIYIKGTSPSLEDCRKVFSESFDFIESVESLEQKEDYTEVEVIIKDDTPEDVIASASVVDFVKLGYNAASTRSVRIYNEYVNQLGELLLPDILFITDRNLAYTKTSKECTDKLYDFLMMLTDHASVYIERLNDTEIIIKPLM